MTISRPPAAHFGPVAQMMNIILDVFEDIHR